MGNLEALRDWSHAKDECSYAVLDVATGGAEGLWDRYGGTASGSL